MPIPIRDGAPRPERAAAARTARSIAVVVGTRPEAIKLAPVIQALGHESWTRPYVVATAQHRELLDQTLGFFEIAADTDLDLMHPDQAPLELMARMGPVLDRLLDREAPDVVVAQGDTTTVLVAALCCFHRKVCFAHVEAGLRTGDRHVPFPEEMNRVLVSRLADLHFAPTAVARDRLMREGVEPARIVVTGNTVVDALLWAAERDLPAEFAPRDGRRLLLVTAHRRENFGEPLEQICHALLDIVEARDVEVLYPVHPNPNVGGVVRRLLGDHPRIRLVAPLDYPDFVAAMKGCHLILTDSGGVQEEAPSLGKPVLVLREQTERPEGVAAGTARIVGASRDRITAETLDLLDDPAAHARMARAENPYGDGRAAQRIVAALKSVVGERLRSADRTPGRAAPV